MSAINTNNEIPIKETNRPSDDNNMIENRDFIIKTENNNYYLIIEIYGKIITFTIIKLNESLEYNYKHNINILKMLNNLELNQNKYSSSESILNLFDNEYENNKILIEEDMKDKDSCNLIIKFNSLYNKSEIIHRIKLKKDMNKNDKINILLRILKQKIDHNSIINTNNQNKNLENKIKEMNEEIKKKDNIITCIYNDLNYLINKIVKRLNSLEKLINISDSEKELESLLIKIEEKINKKYEENYNTNTIKYNDLNLNIKNKEEITKKTINEREKKMNKEKKMNNKSKKDLIS